MKKIIFENKIKQDLPVIVSYLEQIKNNIISKNSNNLLTEYNILLYLNIINIVLLVIYIILVRYIYSILKKVIKGIINGFNYLNTKDLEDILNYNTNIINTYGYFFQDNNIKEKIKSEITKYTIYKNKICNNEKYSIIRKNKLEIKVKNNLNLKISKYMFYTFIIVVIVSVINIILLLIIFNCYNNNSYLINYIGNDIIFINYFSFVITLLLNNKTDIFNSYYTNITQNIINNIQINYLKIKALTIANRIKIIYDNDICYNINSLTADSNCQNQLIAYAKEGLYNLKAYYLNVIQSVIANKNSELSFINNNLNQYNLNNNLISNILLNLSNDVLSYYSANIQIYNIIYIIISSILLILLFSIALYLLNKINYSIISKYNYFRKVYKQFIPDTLIDREKLFKETLKQLNFIN